ncbi:hypothetical protein AMAG_08587 [Allomyces macrogynus ATCC 38327]|uniref:Uncharacterized protein n=1 Tax=Allomyces macrogynus (strain ATCC 38327) TaxID=578462 RepID=A0A0L0SLR9_ALLM3|nr:hypothetical protein AMAG_08587 [Allomyces macrogynus ATCC 38327]|eukprot:KNE63461.1 hypothetical protein AMAG_08587 [Allomyces macrogynus ATCC 38327]
MKAAHDPPLSVPSSLTAAHRCANSRSTKMSNNHHYSTACQAGGAARAWHGRRARLPGLGPCYGRPFSSGSAAIAMVIMMLPKGSHIISVSDVNGGTFETLTKIVRCAQLGLLGLVCRPDRGPGQDHGGHDARDQAHLARVADEPDHENRRYCRGRGACQAHQPGRARRCRQHVPLALLPAPALARRRRGRALGNQVLERPLGRVYGDRDHVAARRV